MVSGSVEANDLWGATHRPVNGYLGAEELSRGALGFGVCVVDGRVQSCACDVVVTGHFEANQDDNEGGVDALLS